MAAVIFDLDGLLIDSEPLWREAEIEVFGSLGLHLTEQEVRQTMGLRIDDAVTHWWSRHPWEGASRKEVAHAVTDRVAELVERTGTPMPGALDAVATCRRLGLPIAVCSGLVRPRDRGRPRPARHRRRGCGLALRRVGAARQAASRRLPHHRGGARYRRPFLPRGRGLLQRSPRGQGGPHAGGGGSRTGHARLATLGIL